MVEGVGAYGGACGVRSSPPAPGDVRAKAGRCDRGSWPHV